MKIEKLALELRKRQFKSYDELKETLSCTQEEWFDILYETSDQEIINSYNTCSCCGEKCLNKVALAKAINKARTAEHFIHLLNA